MCVCVCVCVIYNTLHTVNFQAAQKDFIAIYLVLLWDFFNHLRGSLCSTISDIFNILQIFKADSVIL